MSQIIIGFVGPLASGKDICKKYLIEKYGADSTKFSGVLRDILTRLYLPITRENMQNLSLDLRHRFGSDILARVVTQDIKNSNHEIMVIDGVRRLEDIANLKDLPGFYLISINATPEIRYKRTKLRDENIGDAMKTYEEFVIDGAREAEKEIPFVMATASYHIDNNGSLDDLHQQIEKIIIELKKHE